MRPWQAALAAALVMQVQVNLLAVWPLAGGAPHLIAFGVVPFALLADLRAGLIWIIVGAGLLDLLLPVRFGVTLVPLLVVYGVIRLLARHVVNTPTWWSVAGLAVLAVGGTELLLAITTGNWRQYGRDLFAALILALPLGFLVGQTVTTRHSGLRIR